MLALMPILVERRDGVSNDFTVEDWGIKIPIGTEITGTGVDPKGNLVFFCLIDPSKLRVWHPVLLWPMMVKYQPLIGRTIGKSFGMTVLQQGMFAIFADEPWPQHPTLIHQ